ncbi:MAG: hypothetical protein ABSB65_06115 [Candidatus Acidiferrales bacterium]
MVQTALKLVIVGMIYDLNENIAGMLTMSGGRWHTDPNWNHDDRWPDEH